jgi:hypothetical protein
LGNETRAAASLQLSLPPLLLLLLQAGLDQLRDFAASMKPGVAAR